MKAVNKALWYIENNIGQPVSLDNLAEVAGVSRYHLSRIFCYVVGTPVSRYLRLRRLTHAAISLAAGEPDILALALSLGYSSHEAFSRAFKEAFQRTPEEVRKQGHTDNLPLAEAFKMNTEHNADLPDPRQVNLSAFTLCGLSQYYEFESMAEIPHQWQRFADLLPRLSKDRHPTTYGVIFNSTDSGFEYLSGVVSSGAESSPVDCVGLNLRPQSYLVFDHTGHVSGIRESCASIWSEWLPASDFQTVDAPWFEKYGERFDPLTGHGGLEIWIPVR